MRPSRLFESLQDRFPNFHEAELLREIRGVFPVDQLAANS
jgi:hypothetical protein